MKNTFNDIYIASASERKFPIEKLLTYDLISKNPLFDKDGLISKQNDKSSLVRELEDIAQVGQLFASSDDINFSYNDVETCLVIDVMLMLRAIRWTKLNTFQDLALTFCKQELHKYSLQNIQRIDFVFDSYFPCSPKSSEHIRRSNTQATPFGGISKLANLPKP